MGKRSPAIMLMSVVFPVAFGATRAVTPLGSNRRLRPSITSSPLNSRLTSLSSIMALIPLPQRRSEASYLAHPLDRGHSLL